MEEHIPVLLQESIEHLHIKNGDTIIDATYGSGGHTKKILERVGGDGKVIAIDVDAANISRGEELGIKNLTLVSGNFGDLADILAGLGVPEANGILADLGFSSRQLETVEGLSFQKDTRLDMRLDPSREKTAADIINSFPEQSIADILYRYGEERRARRIAAAIVKARRAQRIETSGQLAELVKSVYGGREKVSGIHVATKTFMAFRIAVNDELNNLHKLLEASVSHLQQGGRIAIISFHSLEDRIVKQFFRNESRACICPEDALKCTCGHVPRLKTITKKPIYPTEAEQQNNPRSRSARLRVAEKTN